VSTRRILALALTLAAATAHAQPAGDKVDAQSLMLSGIRLIDAHDYLGALAVFKDAYARFPSPKILLNIGTALKLLDRKAEAANAYQHYLDDPAADPARRAEVEAALKELDAAVGRLDITVTPADAEVQVNQEDWAPAAHWRVARVEPGPFTVRARKAGFETTAKGASANPAEHVAVQIALAPSPQVAAIETHGGASSGDPGIGVTAPPVEALSRFGVYAAVHLDFPHSGGAALVGLSFGATEQLSIRAAAILGASEGGYAGATFSPFHKTLRPYASGGFPVFLSSGLRYGVRGAAGVEASVSHHLSIVLELGVEHYFNTQMGIDATLFIPAVGLVGRI
jgi:hypothetical protein